MKVTLTSDDGGVYPLDVGAELTVRDLQALAELETAIPQEEMLLMHHTAPLANPLLPLTQCGVKEGDVIMVSRVEGGASVIDPPTQEGGASGVSNPQPSSSLPTDIDWSSVVVPTTTNPSRPHPPSGNRRQRPNTDPDDPETIRQHFLNDPYRLSVLRQRNPPLAEALLSGDRQRFRDALERQNRALRDAERERIRILNADPLDPTYQAKIARDIRERNIEENREAAIEFTPESFSHVVMLYLEIKVNGVPVTALVDSGARSTVMSQACAERCNIMRLVDTRYAGVAFGVGQQRILGRVHLGQLQIGRDFLTSSFTVLETAAEDMLLGLDMLKRHQCCIDLKENCLRIGSTGSSAPFLTEKDIKNKEEELKKQADAFSEKEDYEMAKAIADSEESEMEPSSVPQPSTSQTPSQPPPSQPAQSHTPSEEAISEITRMGFPRDDAIRELARNGGNVQLALAALLARSMTL